MATAGARKRAARAAPAAASDGGDKGAVFVTRLAAVLQARALRSCLGACGG